MTSTGEIEAVKLYQQMLDDIGAAYLARDFDSFCQMLYTPHRFTTKNGTYVVHDQDGLRRVFDSFRQYMVSQNLTDFVRTCTYAKFTGDDSIEGSHKSHLVRNSCWIQEPYRVTSTLRNIDDRWQVCSSINEVEQHSWPSRAVRKGTFQSVGAGGEDAM